MMISYAVLKKRLSGESKNSVVFRVSSPGTFAGEQMELLRQLMMSVRRGGLCVHQAVLAFEEKGELKYFGSRELVDYLSEKGLPRWTHSLKLE